jgi:hypothetical protein
MKKSLIVLALVSACGASDQSGNASSAAAANGAAPATEAAAQAPVGAAVQTSALTGLYEGPPGAQRNQLCMLDKGTGNTQFGLIVWGSNLHSCSGAGSAVRSGERLTLTMAGDSSCAIDATISNGIVTLPTTLPAGCAYYCGARASMSGASFTRTGGTAADAAKAKDLAGDPLC